LSLPENQPGGANYFAGSDAFQKMLVNGIKSAMGLQPFCEAYTFTGFGGLTTADAGSTVKVKFGLGGNQGSDPVVEALSAEASCSTGLPTGTLEPVNAKSLSYDRGTRQYHFNWKTPRSWAGACRQLSLRLDDGTIHTAKYYFE
jgi:hypothetical protein